ncbi:glycosyltransferase involved in cell wall biosynthesis [Luteibacter sp. Sphag1AF]|uniref:glycosyltransferase family 4 protein n=1 Tax=Luteibacter sp. Sphag1AF TaxID=2587031 RepID=UPI00161D096C|nr:glycosyltransferase family 1 protein [Luteibacter sp. Sphag1AF]MBB3225849.1 glycosyltransferase involved in cell wall biosynthesis [Luteibacter sp. Sphag1AF]
MKILLDMQGIQTDSRHRGIGRYCLALSRAFAALAHDDHEVCFAFNGALDTGLDEAITCLMPHASSGRRLVVGPMRHTGSSLAANDARRIAAARVYAHALDEAQADIIWLGSVVEGFADDAVMPDESLRSFTVATLYDLIPLHDPASLGHPRSKQWYESRLSTLRRCDLLLAISDWVRDDAVRHMGIDPARIVTIGAGVDERFMPPQDKAHVAECVRARHGITRSFVMYSGGFDIRKNVGVLIEAFAGFPHDVTAGHQLVLVGGMSAEVRDRIQASIRRAGLPHDAVVFAGFVSDDELVALYQACDLFVFPSQNEGFGLPPLEAMACGAPVLVNDASSLPEVVGNTAALFDGSSASALTTAMREVLTSPERASLLRKAGLQRARHFTWQRVAARALQAIASARQAKTAPIPAPVRLLCVQGATTPAWLDALPAHDLIDVRGRESNPAEQHGDALARAREILYMVDADSAVTVQALLRRWPGFVVWMGPFPANAPTHTAIRYESGGFAAVATAGRGDDLLAWLAVDAVDVMAMDAADAVNPHFASTVMERLTASYATLALPRQLAAEHYIAEHAASALSDDELAQVSDALVGASRRMQPVRWLVDVTQISQNDIGTGVQRVVRSVLRQWLRHPPADVRIEPVAFREGRYVHARSYAMSLLGQDARTLPDTPVRARSHDVFVGLDWAAESMAAARPHLRAWRRQGVCMHFVVHDILPVSLPQTFHPFARQQFLAWLEAITTTADALHCVSRATAQELTQWMHTTTPPWQFGQPPQVDHFLLGVDAPESNGHSDDLPEGALNDALTARATLLMVGTVEPRKGHVPALDALEELWRRDVDVNLVIVGRQGWMVQELADRLSRHGELGRRLFWLRNATDTTLEAVYRRSTALLVPSLGEGFGLPVIEAARQNIPVIARDLPIFREVAGTYPFYFTDDEPRALATLLAQWLTERPSSGELPALVDWSTSARTLAEAVSRTSATATNPWL